MCPHCSTAFQYRLFSNQYLPETQSTIWERTQGSAEAIFNEAQRVHGIIDGGIAEEAEIFSPSLAMARSGAFLMGGAGKGIRDETTRMKHSIRQTMNNAFVQAPNSRRLNIQNQFPESETKYRRIKEFLEQEKLVISPLSYIRGRSLVNVYFIVDEAQNLTPHEIKTIITRAGEGTKMVFTGDIFQIDHPYLDSQSNGLSYMIEKMQGQNLYAHITLEKGERSELAELASNLL